MGGDPSDLLTSRFRHDRFTSVNLTGEIMGDLTERRRKVLEFIRGYVEIHGYPPSIGEIASHSSSTPTDK